jgi:hypothetical protein
MRFTHCANWKSLVTVLVTLLLFSLDGRAQTLAQNTFYFPQIAVGETGGVEYFTAICLTNPSATVANGSFSMRNDSGSPLPALTIENLATGQSVVASSQSFTLAPSVTNCWGVDSSGPVTGGSAVVSTLAPGGNGTAISGTAIYFMELAGGGGNQAGVGAVGLWNQLMIPTANGESGNTRTGIAVTTVAANTLTFTYIDGAGAPVHTTSRTLSANGHLALFVDELFTGFSMPSSPVLAFGTLKVSGTAPFTGVAILFDGPNMTTFPVIPVN